MLAQQYAKSEKYCTIIVNQELNLTAQYTYIQKDNVDQLKRL